MSKGLSGGIYEAEVCGAIEETPRNKLALERCRLINNKGIPYLTFEAAVAEVKKVQPWTDVKSYTSKKGTDVYFPKEVSLELAELLNLEPEEASSRLKYYTAVFAEGNLKSSLDVHHGVDGFFEYYDENGNLIKRITIDASFNKRKIQDRDFKADFLVAPQEETLRKDIFLDREVLFLPDPGAVDEINDDFLDAVSQFSADLAKLFREAEEERREIARGYIPPRVQNFR